MRWSTSVANVAWRSWEASSSARWSSAAWRWSSVASGLLGPHPLVAEVLAGGGELVGDVGAASGGQVDEGLALGDVERVGVVEHLGSSPSSTLADVAVHRHGGLLVLEGHDLGLCRLDRGPASAMSRSAAHRPLGVPTLRCASTSRRIAASASCNWASVAWRVELGGGGRLLPRHLRRRLAWIGGLAGRRAPARRRRRHDRGDQPQRPCRGGGVERVRAGKPHGASVRVPPGHRNVNGADPLKMVGGPTPRPGCAAYATLTLARTASARRSPCERSFPLAQVAPLALSFGALVGTE